MDWDEVTGRLYGLGIDMAKGQRTLSFYHPLKKEWGVVADIPTFFMQIGDVTTIDPQARAHYAILQPGKPGAPGKGPFHLVTTHLDTGKVLHSPQFCPNTTLGCAWSLHGPVGLS